MHFLTAFMFPTANAFATCCVILVSFIAVGKRSKLTSSWDIITDENGEKRVLQGLAFTIDGSREKARRCGRVIGSDVTFGSNNRKRPLLDIITLGGNLETIDFFYALLPDETRESFCWVFAVALPQLMGQDFCDRVRVVVADGDHWQLAAIEYAIHGAGVLRNARFRLCAWHCIFVPFKKLRGQLSKTAGASPVDKLAGCAVRALHAATKDEAAQAFAEMESLEKELLHKEVSYLDFIQKRRKTKHSACDNSLHPPPAAICRMIANVPLMCGRASSEKFTCWRSAFSTIDRRSG